MGNYITRTDVANRLRRTYDTAYTPKGESTVDTDMVDADIEAAEATFDAAAGVRYAIPITDANGLRLAKSISLILVEELAYGAIPGREIPKNVERRIERAYELLDKLRDGTWDLPSGEDAEDERDDGPTLTSYETPQFTRTKLEGF